MDPELVEQARSGDHDAFEVLAAGSRDRVWILGVAGDHFVIVATEFPVADAQDLGELQAIIDSTRVEAAIPTDPPSSTTSP